MSENNKVQLTRLLPNKVLNRIERMRINPLCNFTNKHRGDRLSGRGGNSMDFSDYRDYSPGDDLRFVDWNIFARLQRPYLKLFRVEEEMHVVIIIDASSSMLFDGKLDFAKQLAAAFGVMGLYGNERVSLYSISGEEGELSRFPATSGKTQRSKLLRFIEDLQGGGVTPFETGIDNVMKYHRGKGSVILLSDFLTFGNMKRGMNSLFSSGLELHAIQILSPAEIDPELNGDARFVDSETGLNLDVTAGGDLISIYHEHRESFQEELLKMCKQRSGRFISISSAMSIEEILYSNLLRAGWIK